MKTQSNGFRCLRVHVASYVIAYFASNALVLPSNAVNQNDLYRLTIAFTSVSVCLWRSGSLSREDSSRLLIKTLQENGIDKELFKSFRARKEFEQNANQFVVEQGGCAKLLKEVWH